MSETRSSVKACPEFIEGLIRKTFCSVSEEAWHRGQNPSLQGFFANRRRDSEPADFLLHKKIFIKYIRRKYV
ncbi:hypothetical protein A2973_00175 [Candidatus Gottesmanbacteria bacterium RIFCSPLOWO2_01_FULL_49_10]|uniref:Uncharacterized protein n=1 Tax=Candidatus Gottesmanbacteria bacterium RIFCSPLOWO2_01_FULL_49_10 TaxID=1798396 RepID=A0A1F6B175_9BACT|nr:MAG: hypothetical protein A2973_00175 [Candidatus Gottesmanbacteria bacterium RIFCSPLOWO2_01_FULL_49_10]